MCSAPSRVVSSLPRLCLITLLLSITAGSVFAAQPRAHHIYISGSTAGSNPATVGTMKVGHTLQCWYTYADADGDVEAGTTIQWFSRTSVGGATTLIGTGPTYTLTGTELNKYISVVVTPDNAVDAPGTPREFKAFQSTDGTVTIAGNIVRANTSSCNVAGGGSAISPANNMDATAPLCSPRITSWEVSYVGIDYTSTNTASVFINWGDGGGFTQYTPTLSNPLVTKTDTLSLAYPALQKWVTTQAHTFSYATTGGTSAPSTTVNGICTYTLQATWGTGASDCSANGIQTQPFTVWDKEDNTALGTMDIDKDPLSTGGVEVGEEVTICEQDRTVVRVQDGSDFNCTAAGGIVENIKQNDEGRWVQWVYGIAGTTIVTGATSAQRLTLNGTEDYQASQFPIYGEVTYQATSTAPLPSITDDIQIPTTATNGQILRIQMRIWNTCNKLDNNVFDGGLNPGQSAPDNVFEITGTTNQPGLISQFGVGTDIFANATPIQTQTFDIRVITKPAAPLANNKEFCSGDALDPADATCPATTCFECFELTSASVTGSTIITWYFGGPPGTGTPLTNTGFGTNCRFFKTDNLANTGPQGTMRTRLEAGTSGYYALWATYTTSNGCTSDPVQVGLTIRPAIAPPPTAPTGTSPLCNGSTNIAYTFAAGSANVTIPINNISNTSGAITFATEYLWSTTTGGVTLDATTGTAITIDFNLTPEPNPQSTAIIRARRQYTIDAILGSNGTATRCQSNNSPNRTVAVDGVTAAGTISPAGPQVICEGGAFTQPTLTGTVRGTISWLRQVNGGGYTVIGALGNTITANVTSAMLVAVGNAPTDYDFYASVDNGTCSTVDTSPTRITVNPRPASAALSGNATICAGNSTNLQVNVAPGSFGPFTVNYNPGAVSVTGYTSGTNIPVTPGSTTSYSLISVLDGRGCSAVNLTGTPTVTVNTPAAITAQPQLTRTICQDGSTTFSVAATGSSITYQWQRDPNTGTFANITDNVTDGAGVYSGATTNTLTIDASGDGLTFNNYKYRVVVTGVCAPLTVTSNAGTLTVNAKPSITTQPTNGSNICINGTKMFSVVAAGFAPLTYRWRVNTGSGFNDLPLATANEYSGEDTPTLTINTSGTGVTMSGYTYEVRVDGACPAPVTSSPVTLTIQGPTPLVNGVATATGSVCADNNLVLTGSVSYFGGGSPAAVTPNVWSGTYNDPGPGGPVAIVNADLDLLLNDGTGTYNPANSRRTVLNPVFNTAGVPAFGQGVYVLTLTSTDNFACTNVATFTITVTQVAAAMRYGYTSGAITQTDLSAEVCAGLDVFLNGNPSGGSGVFTGGTSQHTWSLVSGPSLSLSNAAIQQPVFNSVTAGTYVLRYFAQDNGGCNFITDVATDITIVVNPLPTANAQTANLCSDATGGTTATVDLNAAAFLTAINGGGGITYTWYEDYNPGTKTYSNPIAAPGTYLATSANPIFAEVGDANLCVSPAQVTYTVNPRPAAPTGGTDITVCSDVVATTAISVANPGAGLTTDWYLIASGGSVQAGGSGTNSFTPGAAGTYYAETRNTVTNCTSTSRLAVTLTSDPKPGNPTAMADEQTCLDTHPITSTAATNGGTGYWSTANTVYYENFEGFANGTAVDAGVFGWSRDVTGSTVLPTNGVHYWEVRSGRFESDDLDNFVVSWNSSSIDISALTSLDVSVDLRKDGDLETTDFIEAYYRLDAGAFVKFGEISRAVDDGPAAVINAVASVTGLDVSANSTLTIRISVSGNGSGEFQQFDNVTVQGSGGSPVTFDDIFSTSTTVRNLQYGVNVIQWNVVSSLGVCTLTPDQVTITRIAAPAAVAVTDSFCEESAGSNNVTGIDLTDYDDDVSNFLANRAVTWFTNPGRTAAVVDPANVTITDDVDFYAVVTETLSGSLCSNSTDGQITFNVFDRPTVANQTAEFCEDVLNGNTHAGINLNTTFNTAINPTATIAYFGTYNPVGEIFGAAIATPTSYTATDEVLYARVTDGNGCINVATITITINPRPQPNAIIGSQEVCVSTNLFFYQVTQRAGSTYSWNVPADFIVEAAGGGETPGGAAGPFTSDYFILLRFPTVTTQDLVVIERNADGCETQVPNVLEINVASGLVSVPIAGPDDVCNNQAGVVFDVPPKANSNFIWSIAAGSDAVIVGPSSGTNLFQIVVDFGLTGATIEVTEVNASGCPADHPSKVVSPLDVPQVTPTSGVICSGDQPGDVVDLDDFVTLPSTYTWFVKSIDAGIGGTFLNAAGSGQLTHTPPLTNISGFDRQIVYTVTPTGTAAPNCLGIAGDITITVHPEPVIANSLDMTVCSNVATGLNLSVASTSVTASSYNIVSRTPHSSLTVVTAPAIANGVASNFLAGDVFRNTTGGPLDVVYVVMAVGSIGSCAGEPRTITVTINPEPVAGDVTKAAVCSGVPVTFDPQDVVNDGTTTPPGNSAVSTFSWTAAYDVGITVVTGGSGNGTITETLQNRASGNVTLNAVYTITPSVGPCVGDPFDIIVPILAEPVVSATLTETKCSGEAFGKLLATDGVSTPAVSYDVTVLSVAAGLTGGRVPGLIGSGGSADNVLASDAYVNLTASPLKVIYSVVANGASCPGPARLVEFTVSPEPVLSIPTPPAICSREISNIVLSTNGTSVGAANYRISSAKRYSSNGGAFTSALPANFLELPGNAVGGVPGGANLIRNDRYNNTSEFQVVVEYSVVPKSPSSSGGCDGDPVVILLPVNPEPIMSPGTLGVCSATAFGTAGTLGPAVGSSVINEYLFKQVQVVGSPDIPLIAGPSNAAVGTTYSSSTFLANDSWTNVNAFDVHVIYTIAPITLGCSGTDQTLDVTIFAAPAVKAGLDKAVCNGTASGIILLDNSPISAGAASYDITAIMARPFTGADQSIAPGQTITGLVASNDANSETGVTTLSTQIANDRFTNLTDERITIRYTVVPRAVGGCDGPPVTISLVVEPTIRSVSANTTAIPLCSDASPSVSIQLQSPTYSGGSPSVTFSYLMQPAPGITGNSTASNVAEGFIISDNLVNTSNEPVTVHYRITPFAAAAANGLGCDTGSGVLVEDVAVIVQPRPKVNAINNKTICSNQSADLSLVSPTYPSAPANIEFVVTAVALPDAAGMSGFVATRTVPNSATINDILINTSAVTKLVQYTIVPQSVTGVGGCIGIQPLVVVVTVSPRPLISPIADFSICSGDSFTPVPISTDTETAVPGSTLVTWTVVPNASVSGESNGAGNAFSQVLFNNTTDKQTVEYLVSAGNIANAPACAANAPIALSVTVYPAPKVVSLPTSFNVCNNGSLIPNPFGLTSSVVPALNTIYDWTVDNGGNPDLPAIPPVVGGTQINQLFVNNGAFMGTYQYTIKPYLIIPASANPIIELGTDTDGRCDGILEGIMVVNVSPAISGSIFGFDIDGNQAKELFVCLGSTTSVNFEPVGLPLMDLTYTENGVGKTLTRVGGLKQLSVTPTATTVFELRSIKDQFGCIQPITGQRLTINVDAVDNTFLVEGPEIACSPFPARFRHDQDNDVSYTWKWMDGPDSTTYRATSSVPGRIIRHVFTSTSPSTIATYRVQLDAFLDTTRYLGGCRKRPFVKEIRVHPNINMAVFPNKDVICSDEQVSFVNSSQGATIHKWYYRLQGTTEQIDPRTTPVPANYRLPNHTTSNPVILEVVYEANNAAGCPTVPVVTPITVYRGVEAGFTHTEPTVFVAGSSTADFTNTSNPVDAADFRYEWDFGLDSNPLFPQGVGPFHVNYSTAGPKDIVLVVTNLLAEAQGLGCTDEFSQSMQIAVPPLTAEFTVIPEISCFPTDLTVTENLATGDQFAWRVRDAGGTAASSNAVLPVFKIPAPGVYIVELVTTNTFTGDEMTATKEVTIYDTPIASFDLYPTTVFVPDGVLQTFNYSKGASEYEWDFGDGDLGDMEKYAVEPEHSYQLEGVYTITLIAKNDHGVDRLGNAVVCVDTLTRNVTAKQGGVIRLPNAFTPNLNGSTSSSGTPGQPGSNTFNDVFLPQVKGAEDFNMQVFDRWGNLIFESNNANEGWDGYDRNGKLMPAGVYVYKLDLRLSDGQRIEQVGDITMIR